MNSETIMLYNAIAYTLALTYFYWKGKLNLAFVLWICYTISAWSSYLFIQQPLYKSSIHYCEITIFPCIYLFLLIFICIKPFVRIQSIDKIEVPNEKKLKYTLYVFISIQIILLLATITSVENIVTSSAELADIRAAAYKGETSDIGESPMLNRLSLLYSGIRPLATGLSVCLLFMLDKQRNLIRIFAITTLLTNIQVVILTAGRGEMVIALSIYVCTLFLIRNALSKRVKKILTLYAIPIIIISISFFWAITVSRFGDSATFFMYKYMGESMNNFNGILFSDIKGYTEGRVFFSYIYRYLLGETPFVNTEGRHELTESVNKIPGFIFYTYIGNLVMDFGKITTVFIAILLNRLANRLLAYKHIHLGVFAIYVAVITLYVCGVFFYYLLDFVGLSMFITLFILYHLYKNRFKKQLNKNIDIA